ncbi:hypothetical protein QOZ80_6AG0535860 [Eleusine coracana subsp. coracana]|nr:hypothetical protein QOZ80_6AG0535860 [Eleusine coracana subsp. coracana]
MSASSSSSGTNPFAPAAAVAITAATAQLINIKSHVPVTLDLGDSNFGTWRTFFLIAFRKFGVLDHIDGTRFSHLMLDDTDWTQIDTCIVSWLYTTLSSDLLTAVIQPPDDAYTTWTAITDQFLDNVIQRTVQARQAFHALHQEDMTISEYCGKIKVLSDTLRDVGAPVSDPDLVVHLLSGLNDKFGHCITTISAARPRMTFRQAWSFLLQEESWMTNRAKKAAATALLSSSRSGGAAPATPAVGSAAPPPPLVPPAPGQPSGGNDNRARNRKKNDGRPRSTNGQAARSLVAIRAALPRWPLGTIPGTVLSRPGRSRRLSKPHHRLACWALDRVSSHSSPWRRITSPPASSHLHCIRR